MSENSPLDDIAYLIAEFEEQKKIIYAHYSQAVASVITGRITAENEIERIMDGLLDFGKDGYIPLDYDTEPNFLGETMTASEFVEEETQDEVMRMNGM